METLEILCVGLSLSATCCYLMALLCKCLDRRENSLLAGVPYVKYIFAVVGWLFNLGLFVKNWYVNGYAPFASMYQVLCAISLCFMVMYLLLTRLYKDMNWLFGYFCVAACVPLVGTVFMDRQVQWSLVPALRSGFFVPHVFSYVVSYSLLAVVFCLTVICMCTENKKKYLDAIYRLSLLDIPFMTAGLMLGALWADDVWGNFWQWDVKEVWSLISFAFYLGYFHMRRTSKNPKWQYLFIILTFISVIITFLFVNVFKTDSLHVYT